MISSKQSNSGISNKEYENRIRKIVEENKRNDSIDVSSNDDLKSDTAKKLKNSQRKNQI
jgi:hypothetical protein